MKEIKIENRYNNLLLKKYLSEVLGYSRRNITRLHTNRLIFVNKENKNLTYKLQTGDVLKIESNNKQEASKGNLEILYIDEHLVIINKPAGLCAHPNKEHKIDATSILEKQLNKKAYPTGRLDKNVSGIMLFGLNREITSKLNKLREANKLNKYYKCVVKGCFDLKEGRLIYSLSKDPKTHKYLSDEKGKKCLTDYVVLKQTKDLSLLKIHILTGRSHQIRAGLAIYNHPIIGDFMYYKNDNRLSRVALHASNIEFIHPYTNKEIKIDCPLPKELENLINERKIK